MATANLQQCNEDDVQSCMQADLVKTYRTIYSLREFDLPFTATGFDDFFGPTIQFFAGDQSKRTQGISSNTTLTNAVDMPFLVRCIAIYITVEPLGFTAAGAAVATPAAANTNVPFFDGVQIDLQAAPGVLALGVASPAWLEWGIPTWKAAHALMQAYRLQMLLGGRLELFNELNADVGNIDSHSQWVGFSNSLSELPLYVAHVNANERTNTRGLIFLPATAQQVIQPGASTVSDIGVPTPLVQASWGGPKMDGLFCGCYPVRGILLVPGMPINLNMIRDDGDVFYYTKLKEALVEASNVVYDVNYSGDVKVNGTVVASTKFTEFKGGTIRIGITMRGFELTPRAAVQWYGTYGGSFGQLYMVQAQKSLLTEYAIQIGIATGLAGVPAWLAGGAGLDEAEQATELARSASANGRP